MSKNLKRRVVITGLGIIAPNGIGQEAFWQATLAGISGIKHFRAIHDSPIQVAGIIENFLAEDYIDRKLINRTDRMTHFVLAAIQEALADARLHLEQEDPQRVGAVIANTMGGMNYVLQQTRALYTRGPRFMSAYTAIAWLNVTNVGQAAILYGIQGYCKTPINDSVGGLNALGMAYGALQRGAADVIITGGCEAFLNPTALVMLSQQGSYVTGTDTQAYRPFDRRASGLILAEGSGICILEDYEHALKRGAHIYGEIVGYGQTNDAHGPYAPSSDGTRYAKALQQVMHEGDITLEEIVYINLDGRAQTASDLGEADALHLALGSFTGTIPMSVPRTMIGHSYAAAGAIDTITALLTLKHGLVAPTINCEQYDPRYGLNIVRERANALPTRSNTVHTSQVALVGGRNTGGVNVVLALRRSG